jgi:hypothetical protein
VLEIAVDARPEIFERILKEAPGEPDRAHRQEMYDALGTVRDVARQKQALALILDPKIDIRETMGMLRDVDQQANRAVSQQFFRDHQDEIMKRLPQDETTSPIAGFSWLFTGTCKADERDAIAAFVTQRFGKLPGGARVVKQSIEGMDQCIARRKLLDPEVRAWLGGIRIPKPKP